MALHDGLSRWQKILLGVLCFPFLPFYLCAYYLSKKKSNEDIQQEEGRRTDDRNTIRIFSITPINKVHVEEEGREGQKDKEKALKSSNFKYPWDKSDLKSLHIDLKKFEALDDYAAKLPSSGSLDHLTKQLIHGVHTDLEKVRAIWIWICHHIEYDFIGLKNKAMRSSVPEEILRRGKGVCAGYSSLFQDMCSLAGVTCKTVSGYGKGARYQVGQKIPEDSNHAWNMVYLEGRWHLLDSTWGAGHGDIGQDKFTFQYNEYYFLTHPALFIGDHYPNKKEHQLLEPRVSRKQFEKCVYLKGNFYNSGLLSVQPDTGIITSGNGKVSITIQSRQNMEFTFNGAERGLMKLLKCGMELDVYLEKPGQHELKIYARGAHSKKTFHWVLSYKILCKAVDPMMKISKCLSNPVGPSWVTEEAGLVEPSHPEPVIHTVDGCCAIRFTTTRVMDFTYSLVSDEISMTSDMKRRHVFLFQTKDKVEMKVHLPRSGTYVLKIYIKPEGSTSSSYNFLCNYLIICTNPSVKWPFFPMVYNSWCKHFDLIHPLEGVLPKNSNVSFKLQIPDVTNVCINGEQNTPLTLTDSGYWEGSCSTGDRKDLVVMIPYNGPNSWQHILKYEVSK